MGRHDNSIKGNFITDLFYPMGYEDKMIERNKQNNRKMILQEKVQIFIKKHRNWKKNQRIKKMHPNNEP